MKTDDDNSRPDADGERAAAAGEALPESQAVRKDMSYSPASESDTQHKQDDPLPDTIDDDIDPDDIRAVPGTGGPDDVGDVDVDPEDLNMPGRS
ncbi:hypothetical protein [Microbacterium lushaniae]|uniref:hypothetical protein n=1 Tax=Microbacterium lushaniae TaxID=2614639 RepID=UPI001EE86503|nr:hypothetical protein [Microbacterium lushaniae]